jgi:GNAT superfamily N-acetyltransferase
MNPRIREAVADDIAPMHAIRMAVRENRLADPGWLTPAMYRACLADTGVANTWVSESDGVMTGFCAVRIAERDIWALFVDPDREGQGAGRALLDTATRWMFGRGIAAIELSTTPDTRADRFYRDAGWQRGELTAKGEVMYRLPSPSARVDPVSETAPC